MGVLFMNALLSKQHLSGMGHIRSTSISSKYQATLYGEIPLCIQILMLNSYQEDRDLHLAAKAFSVVNQSRRLPALLENFLGGSFTILFHCYLTPIQTMLEGISFLLKRTSMSI